jgi:hypothetical protein
MRWRNCDRNVSFDAVDMDVLIMRNVMAIRVRWVGVQVEPVALPLHTRRRDASLPVVGGDTVIIRDIDGGIPFSTNVREAFVNVKDTIHTNKVGDLNDTIVEMDV